MLKVRSRKMDVLQLTKYVLKGKRLSFYGHLHLYASTCARVSGNAAITRLLPHTILGANRSSLRTPAVSTYSLVRSKRMSRNYRTSSAKLDVRKQMLTQNAFHSCALTCEPICYHFRHQRLSMARVPTQRNSIYRKCTPTFNVIDQSIEWEVLDVHFILFYINALVEMHTKRARHG